MIKSIFKKALGFALVWAGLGACSFGQSYIIPNENSSPVDWTGVHTFAQSPFVPDPTEALQAANKEYVDAHSGVDGVTSINSTTGAFTFEGAGVSCTGTDPVICTFSGGGGGSTPAGPGYALNGANGPVTAFTADPDMLFNPTSGILSGTGYRGIVPHSIDLIGGPTNGYTNPTVNDAYEKYQGLPTEYNVLTDCTSLTGLQTTGDGTTDDLQAVQQCIWQRKHICPTPGTVCTPGNHQYNVPDLGPVKFVFPPRNFTRGIGVNPGACDYYFSNQLDLPYGTEIESTGGGKGDTSTTFCFAAGSNGLIVQGFSIVNNIMLYGNSCWKGNDVTTYILPSGFGGSATGDGVVGTQESQLTNVSAWCFGRHGFNMSSTNTEFPGSENDAGYISRAWAEWNGGWGFYYHGNDSQESICSGCEANFNQLGGFWDDSIYGNLFDAPLTQGNHEDTTTFTALPNINNISCTLGSASVQSICTLTFASVHGLYPGSVLNLSAVTLAYTYLAIDFSPYCLNASGVQCGVQSTPTTTTVTVNNPTYYPDNETGSFAGATTAPGTNIWAAAGSLRPGQPAWGASVYCYSGQWNLAYSEGNEPYGTCKSGNTGGSQSLMVAPEGSSAYYPLGGFISGGSNSSGQNGITTGLVKSQPENSSVMMTSGGAIQGVYGADTVWDIFDVLPSNSNNTNAANVQLSEIFFARTGALPQSPVGDYGPWYCWFLGNNGTSSQYTGNLSKASTCIPDQQNGQLISPLIITNGGTGYTSPTFWLTNSTVQPTFQYVLTSGVITSVTCGPCGSGNGISGSTIKVYDATGTGAIITYTYPDEPWPSSASGRSLTQNHGIDYAPAYRALGTVGVTMQPQMMEFMCSAAPTTGQWYYGDICYNTAYTGSNTYAWKNTATGFSTPGTWFPLSFAGTGVLGINSVAGAFTFTGGGVSCISTTCTFSGSGGGVSSFVAPGASWPTWLVPTVTNPTTTPSLAVAASAIPNTALANASTTVNGQSCTLGSTCTIPFDTNSAGNTSQAGINLETSTANAVGLIVTPVNTGTNVEKFEITGGSYTGNAATATNATNVGVTSTATNATFYIPFISGDTTGNYNLNITAGPNYNPSTGAFVIPAGSGANSLQLGTNIFSALPTCNSGAEGTSAPVTDSTTNTWGATITGSGSDHVLAYCDGSAWTVEAK